MLALGLVRHLAIRNNLPLPRVAAFFSKIYHLLVVETVAKTESQVQGSLETREGILQDYAEESFLDALDQWFAVEDSVSIDEMDRMICLSRQRRTNA